MLGGDLGLDAAPRPAVARDHNGSLYRHTHAVKTLIIGAYTQVYIHQRRGHIAVDAVGVISRQLLGLLVGGWVPGHRRLLQLRLIGSRRNQGKGAFFGCGKEDVEGFNLRLQPPLFELRQDPLRIFLIVG